MVYGMGYCRCMSPRLAEAPSLTELVPQLAALAAEAAAAAAEAAASSARSEAEREPCSWFKCPISLVSFALPSDLVVCRIYLLYELICGLLELMQCHHLLSRRLPFVLFDQAVHLVKIKALLLMQLSGVACSATGTDSNATHAVARVQVMANVIP